MSTTPAPIGFILTFFAGFIGSVGTRVAGSRPNVQAVRSIDGSFIDSDNGLPVLIVTDFAGCRHHVTADWLTAVRPAERDVVGQLV